MKQDWNAYDLNLHLMGVIHLQMEFNPAQKKELAFAVSQFFLNRDKREKNAVQALIQLVTQIVDLAHLD